MVHKLLVELQEDVYLPLAGAAARTGVAPEVVAAQWLKAVCEHAARDPVEAFIGAFPSNIADWSDHHEAE